MYIGQFQFSVLLSEHKHVYYTPTHIYIHTHTHIHTCAHIVYTATLPVQHSQELHPFVKDWSSLTQMYSSCVEIVQEESRKRVRTCTRGLGRNVLCVCCIACVYIYTCVSHSIVVVKVATNSSDVMKVMLPHCHVGCPLPGI